MVKKCATGTISTNPPRNRYKEIKNNLNLKNKNQQKYQVNSLVFFVKNSPKIFKYKKSLNLYIESEEFTGTIEGLLFLITNSTSVGGF